MKWYTDMVHNLVRVSHLEEFFVRLARTVTTFRKLIPLPKDYNADDVRVVKRDNALFRVTMSDYMQWHLFADIPDNNWKYALNTFKPGHWILDVGANCGHFTLKVQANLKAQRKEGIVVHAFEPNPVVAGSLIKNCQLNNVSQQEIVVHQIALGDRVEQRSFEVRNENMGAGHISLEKNNGGLQVDVITLDLFVNQRNPKGISFIKIDTEGFEPEVFRGATNTIRQFKPTLYFEVTPSWYRLKGNDEREIFNLLQGLNYTLWIEKEGSLELFLHDKYKSLFQYNILAKPE